MWDLEEMRKRGDGRRMGKYETICQARGNDDVMHVNGRNEQKKKRTAVKKCVRDSGR